MRFTVLTTTLILPKILIVRIYHVSRVVEDARPYKKVI